MMDLPTRLEQELSAVREQYSDRKKTFQEIMRTENRIEEENPYALRVISDRYNYRLTTSIFPD